MRVREHPGWPRREFLRWAGAASAGVAVRPGWAAAVEGGKRTARVYVTSDSRKHAALSPVVFRQQADASGPGDVLVVDSSQSFQPMLGFGCAYTDASCFLLSTMSAEARQAFLEDTFSPAAMNLNMGRTTIGASDYSRDLYSYDDVAGDVGMQHFSIAHDEAYILPALRAMRRINPQLFLLSTPWSPPGWMKTYGSMRGGWMQSRFLGPYAVYLSRFLEAYRAAGVPIDAVTSQNEPEADQGGSMPATLWPPELESDFVRDHLGPLLRQTGDRTQIWLLDHNYNLWKRVRWQMQDPELRRYVSGVAWHGYAGTPDMMSRLHDAEPELPFYWTEGGPDYTDPHSLEDWTRWGSIFTAAITNWCGALIAWNLMLDPEGKPNIGPFSCGGLVTLRADGSLLRSGQYWALRHFSEHVRRGAVRLGSHTDAAELDAVSFRNPDGSHVAVLTNRGEERTVRLHDGTAAASIPLDRRSIATVVW